MPFQLIMVCDVCVGKCSRQLMLTLHLYHRFIKGTSHILPCFIAASINKWGHVKAIRGISFLKSVSCCRGRFERLAPQNWLLASVSAFPLISLSFFLWVWLSGQWRVWGRGEPKPRPLTVCNQLISSTQLTHLSHLNHQLHFKNSSLDSCTVCVLQTHSEAYLMYVILFNLLWFHTHAFLWYYPSPWNSVDDVWPEIRAHLPPHLTSLYLFMLD